VRCSTARSRSAQKAVPDCPRPEQSGLHRARRVSDRRGLTQLFLRVQVPRAERPPDPPAPLERPRRRHPQALSGDLRDAADQSGAAP
jgi:hypothetical protein